ncbi:MAG: transposase family protein [Clostridiales Family XIII bacterium]|jgi:hypothetical protein|nr:transposase family protein [Clostridiales Family XIII bacterium]
MAKIGMKARNEVIGKQKKRYRKSAKKAKGEILDGVCQATGLSRDRAARLLSECGAGNQGCKGPPKKRGRKTVYGPDVDAPLRMVWACMDFACGKRLAAGMGDMLDALIAHGEIECTADVEAQLRSMSASTMDRRLAPDRAKTVLRGISATKPGTLLKRDIPLRHGTEWGDAIPGYVEIDLVAHCGTSTAGEYINTLNITDICTGWTEPVAVINKAQKHVFEGLVDAEARQPFPYLGIDSDNGSEFINHELYRYCRDSHICFTRGRPNKKNDGCHVEQKNWSLVRRHIGYARYEGKAALKLLNEYYGLLRLLVNFFLPSTKLTGKERDGARVTKKYDTPTTPYRRALASEYIPEGEKRRLAETFSRLNPAELQREMKRVYNELYKLGTS